ncbi:MAG: UbiA family prenyltransferase [Gammaproteobacteria bacterium]|nr:UbiA family prenyltransferase [Gammaproteobacteria bacterium]
MEQANPQAVKPPLVVDLDGTLIKSDLLYESVFGLLRINPFYIFLLPVWLAKGRAHMKQMIAERVSIHVERLPWNTEFLDFLRAESQAGRHLVLATASNERYARAVNEHLGLFDLVLGSTATRNLKGSKKLRAIQDLMGDEPFSYAADAPVDLNIWSAASSAVVVGAGQGLADRAGQVTRLERHFPATARQVVGLGRAMRPHQWLKNLLIFVPLVLSHQINNVELLLNALLGFIAFSLCASSVYLLNDLLDLDSDRQHPTKCRRPFAAGELSIPVGVAALVALLLIAFAIAFSLPTYFVYVLAIYYAFTMAYSIWLKRAALIDGLVLAGLYTMRLIAGAAAIDVRPTFWLLAFSIFIFLSLALIKRYSELLHLHNASQEKLAGRAYRPVDQETLAQLGTASGYLAVLVLALYINGDTVTEQYARPEALWFLCPMMLYWVSRMWLLTRRGEMHDDPVVFTVRDVRTWWLALIAGGALLVAIFWVQLRPFLPLPG